MFEVKNELLLISIATDSHRNIGCLSLYATAVEAEVSTNLLFIPREAEYSEEEFSKLLKTNNYKVVGVSLTTKDFYFAQIVTAHIRKYLPQAHIVWGGIHATCKPEECLNYADSICIGEGEESLIQLIIALRDGVDISDIPGIGVKVGNKNELVMNRPRLIEDLNSLAFPRFDFEHFYVLDACGLHMFGFPDYSKYARHNGDGYVLLTSRACPHRCSYCINSFLNRLYDNNFARLHRRLTVDNTLKEISYALATIPGISFINFMDDLFLTDNKWIEEFCEKYKKLINLPFIIRATPNTVNHEQISLLKDAGLHTVQMGIQSGNEHTHKTIFHRSFKEADVLRAAKILNNYDLECLYDFIIDNDFETDQDRDKTIEFMLRLPKPYTASLFAMTVFPKTDLEAMYEQRKMIPRIDPYLSNYYNLNEDNFYFQLASLVPLIDEKEVRYVLRNREDPQVLAHLKKLFLEKVSLISR